MTQESERRMRIGLVGLKGINRWLYLPPILAHPRVQLVGGADPDAAVAEGFARETGAPVFPSLKEMAKAVELNAVMIGTPNHIHLLNIREAAELGLPMCVTKPMTNTVADAREALRVCRAAGVTLAVGQEWRFRPVLAELRRRVAAGEVGQVSMVQAHMSHRGGITKLTNADNWRSKPGTVPGGCANLLGTHCYDYANCLLGQPTHVVARHARLVAPVELDDTTLTLIEYQDGCLAQVSSSYCSAPSDWVRVYGTQANLFADCASQTLHRQDGKQWTAIDIPDGPGSGHAIVDMFARAVMDHVPAEVDGVAGALAVALLEASITSSQSGQREPVATFDDLA